MSTYLLILFIALGLVSAQTPAQTGYIVRTDFTESSCAASSTIRTVAVLVNVCAPPSYIVAQYFAGAAQPISIQYHNDSTCEFPTSNSASLYSENTCVVGTSTSYMWSYSATLPTLQAGLSTYALYNPEVSSCGGSLYYLTQSSPICFQNAYGSFQSQIVTCHGTTQNSTTCTDTQCSVGCVTAISQLSGQCSASTHDVNSCGAPATSGSGQSASSTGASNPSSTTSSKSSTTSSNPSSTTSSNPSSTTASNPAATGVLTPSSSTTSSSPDASTTGLQNSSAFAVCSSMLFLAAGLLAVIM